MELYQLRTFVTVAEEGHLTRAAQRLHTSQPSVSAHIKALEEEFEVSLFIRTPKGMCLTPAGAVMHQKALATLASVCDLEDQARALNTDAAGDIKLGLHIDPRYLRIGTLMHRMRTRHPKVTFHLLQRWTWKQTEDLLKGELDAGFLYGTTENKNLEPMELHRFNLRVVGPVDWADRIKAAEWTDIAAMPWIRTPGHCVFCDIGERVFIERGLSLQAAAVADQEPVVRSLVTAGLGLAFMIEDEAMDAKTLGEVAVWDQVVGQVILSLVVAARRRSEPLIRALVEEVGSIWSNR